MAKSILIRIEIISRKYLLLYNFSYLLSVMSKVDTITIAIVLSFAAFIVAGLAITPVLVQDADAERKKPKKSKDNVDFTIEEPEIKLVKNNKEKNPNHKNGRGSDI